MAQEIGNEAVEVVEQIADAWVLCLGQIGTSGPEYGQKCGDVSGYQTRYLRIALEMQGHLLIFVECGDIC